MERKDESVLSSGPQSSRRLYSGTNAPSTVFGFNVSANQFQVLEPEQSAASSRSTEQRREGLIDPRTTRQRRWAAREIEAQRTEAERATVATVSVENTQEICTNSGRVINPVVFENSSPFFHSFSVSSSDILQQSVEPVHYLLETGASVDDALYSMGVKDVACMLENCNKRISDAGPERSAGRPGHTPSRRNLACGKTIEDSCAGPDWSAGRPGIMPFGARSAACPSPITACLGPYGTASR